MRTNHFIDAGIYHVYNRGADKRKIFSESEDYVRFIHDLFEFNDTSSAAKFFQFSPALQYSDSRRPNIVQREKRNLLVEILAFCLMPNHFHLILRQKRENGISLFMRKIGGGYAKYFNEKYERVGVLFQGRFKAIKVDNEPYLLHLSRYIHLNPVELAEPSWKEKGIKDWKKANQFLKEYRWSSYLDYIGKNNFPSLTAREFLSSLFDNNFLGYEKFVKEWAVDGVEEIQDIIIEK